MDAFLVEVEVAFLSYSDKNYATIKDKNQKQSENKWVKQ